MNEHEKKDVFEGVIEDQKQAFRMEQITMEGNDPAETGEKSMDMMGGGGAASGAAGGQFGGMGGAPTSEDWGGSEKGRFKKDINPHGGTAEDMANATKYKKSKNGKREFKGKSPLATSKGSTLVAREGLLRSLKQIFEAARKADKKVSICGELGGDPMATMLLLGLGDLGDLSMEPHSIPKVKKLIRLIRIEEARQMADHVLNLSSVEEISRFIANEMRTRFPEDFNRDLSFQENLKPA